MKVLYLLLIGVFSSGMIFASDHVVSESNGDNAKNREVQPEFTYFAVAPCSTYQPIGGDLLETLPKESKHQGSAYYYNKSRFEYLSGIGIPPHIARWRSRKCDFRSSPPKWQVIHKAVSIDEAIHLCSQFNMELVTQHEAAQEVDNFEMEIYPTDIFKRKYYGYKHSFTSDVLSDIMSLGLGADGLWLQPKKEIQERDPSDLIEIYSRHQELITRISELEALSTSNFYLGNKPDLVRGRLLKEHRFNLSQITKRIKEIKKEKHEASAFIPTVVGTAKDGLEKLDSTEIELSNKSMGSNSYPNIKNKQGKEFKGLPVCKEK